MQGRLAAATGADRPVVGAGADNITEDILKVGVKGGKGISEGT